MKDEEKCGETTADGTPCKRAAGWGTDQPDGPCRYHTEDKHESMKETLKEIAELLEDEIISVREACRRSGISVPTYVRYRDKFPELDERIEQAVKAQEDARVKAVEDAMFREAIEGETTGAERIFWLKNRAPERWSDKKELEHSGAIGRFDMEEAQRKMEEEYAEQLGLEIEHENDGETE